MKTAKLKIQAAIIIGLCLFHSYASAASKLMEKISQKAQEKNDYHLTLKHAGFLRKYNIHLPPSYNKDTPAPMVIYLHGGGGSIQGAYKDGLDKASDKFGFILAVPAGTGILPNRLLTWNAGQWSGGDCCGPAFKNNIDDTGFISRMIEELKKRFNVDEKRIYVTGISNGAMMSYRLACELGNKIAAVAAIAAPAIPEGCVPSVPVSIMQINGTADPAVPFKGGKGGGVLGKTFQSPPAQELIDSWIKMNECSMNQTTSYQKGKAVCITYGPCKNGVEVEFCTVLGMGHTWPSGHQYMPASKVGPVSYDISFEQIWEFFKKHPKQ